MQFKTRELIKELETNIKNSYSLPIFRGYKAVNKRGVEKLIDELYANLPDDVQKARDFLKNSPRNSGFCMHLALPCLQDLRLYLQNAGFEKQIQT